MREDVFVSTFLDPETSRVDAHLIVDGVAVEFFEHSPSISQLVNFKDCNGESFHQFFQMDSNVPFPASSIPFQAYRQAVNTQKILDESINA